VTESFSIIPNKKYGKQNFVKVNPQTNEVAHPYNDTFDEMLVFNSIKDQNAISLIYTFPPNNERLWNKSTFLIGDLLQHEGSGGLYSCLKEQGLIDKIYTDD